MKSLPGMSLVEMLAVTAILALVVTAASTLYVAGYGLWSRGAEAMDVQQSLRIAIDWMVDELRWAEEIETCLEQGADNIVFISNKKGVEARLRFRLHQHELVVEKLKPTGSFVESHNKIAMNIDELYFYRQEGSKIIYILLGAGEGGAKVTVRSAVLPLPGQKEDKRTVPRGTRGRFLCPSRGKRWAFLLSCCSAIGRGDDCR